MITPYSFADVGRQIVQFWGRKYKKHPRDIAEAVGNIHERDMQVCILSYIAKLLEEIRDELKK